jgi:hypothetical protein
MASAARRRREILELMMVAIYFVLTAYLFVCHFPSPIGFVYVRQSLRFKLKRAPGTLELSGGLPLGASHNSKAGRDDCQAKSTRARESLQSLVGN